MQAPLRVRTRTGRQHHHAPAHLPFIPKGDGALTEESGVTKLLRSPWRCCASDSQVGHAHQECTSPARLARLATPSLVTLVDGEKLKVT
jgi:hypothetical protein